MPATRGGPAARLPPAVSESLSVTRISMSLPALALSLVAFKHMLSVAASTNGGILDGLWLNSAMQAGVICSRAPIADPKARTSLRRGQTWLSELLDSCSAAGGADEQARAAAACLGLKAPTDSSRQGCCPGTCG